MSPDIILQGTFTQNPWGVLNTDLQQDPKEKLVQPDCVKLLPATPEDAEMQWLHHNMQAAVRSRRDSVLPPQNLCCLTQTMGICSFRMFYKCLRTRFLKANLWPCCWLQAPLQLPWRKCFLHPGSWSNAQCTRQHLLYFNCLASASNASGSQFKHWNQPCPRVTSYPSV